MQRTLSQRIDSLASGVTSFIEKSRTHDWIELILIAAVLHGLIFAFIDPPWWHYDEAGHFEYAWLVVHRTPIPGPNDFDESMRRQLAVSLDHYHYYDYINYKLDLSSNQPVPIGPTQLTDLPLYYWYASLPLRLLPNADFAIQNYAMRLFSLLLLLGTVWIAWKTLAEITAERHPLRWMVPLFMALLPSFVEIMTSINDDVGATFAFSLFILFSVRLLKRGFGWKDFIALLVSIVLCLGIKRTTWPALPLGLFILFLVILRNKKWVGWLMLGLGVLAGLTLLLRWDEAKDWFPITDTRESTRVQTSKAPFGEYALEYSPGQQQILQNIPTNDIRPVRNQTVTLGVWMWADQASNVSLPHIALNGSGRIDYLRAHSVDVGTQPKFFSYTLKIPNDSGHGWVILKPYSSSNSPQPHIYYDGLALVPGNHLSGPPKFTSSDGSNLQWDGQNYRNIIRNPSAESAWMGTAFYRLGKLQKYSPFNFSIALVSIQDTANHWYYRRTAQELFQTFWARFAKNYVPLLGSKSYVVLLILTILGVFGVLLKLIRSFNNVDWDILLSLGTMLFLIWIQTILRGASSLGVVHNPVVPWARYSDPAIIPTALLLCAGWLEIVYLLKPVRVDLRASSVLFIGFLLGLDVFSWISIASFFYWQGSDIVYTLFLVITMVSGCLAGLLVVKARS